jgi:protoheme IX farnesyltransferase
MPKGTITSKQGCFIGTGLGLASVATYTMFEPFTWAISSAIWFSYLCIYIPMKKSSPMNTLAGAVVGALPPFIGTMAQLGTIINPETALLSLYIFAWQYPHFYGILYANREDYKKAGFNMISNEDP